MSRDHINFLQEFEAYMAEHSLQNKEIQPTECTFQSLKKTDNRHY